MKKPLISRIILTLIKYNFKTNSKKNDIKNP